MMELKENTPVQEKDSTPSSKKKFDWGKASHIATVFSSISVVIAIITLAIAMYPQLIWRNTNYIERANAGDIYSQMFLADHCYETGQYSEAIYWYKIASVSKQRNYSYFACNNLAYLYANGYGISNHLNEELCRLEKALLLFEKAAKHIEVSKDNICILLRASAREDFPNISNNRYESLLEDYEINATMESVSYEYFKISYGPIFWKDNKKYVGGQYVNCFDDVGQYLYRVYTYPENADLDNIAEEYVYIGFDEMGLE